jgi:hypothetical protein
MEGQIQLVQTGEQMNNNWHEAHQGLEEIKSEPGEENR